MHCLTSVYFLNQPLHVSGIFVAHHQELYLLTPWCRVLLEKLNGLQLVKKFPVFHGTRRFITVFTSIRHLSLSWANPIRSIYPHPTSCRYILIFSAHLRMGLPIGPFPSNFPPKTYTPHLLNHTRQMPSPQELYIYIYMYRKTDNRQTGR